MISFLTEERAGNQVNVFRRILFLIITATPFLVLSGYLLFIQDSLLASALFGAATLALLLAIIVLWSKAAKLYYGQG